MTRAHNYGGMVPAEYLEEVDRLLPHLATPGVMLLTGQGLARALVVQTEAPALVQIAKTSTEVAGVLLAAALIEPFGKPGEVLRFVISEHGRAFQEVAAARAARRRQVEAERAGYPSLSEIRRILGGPLDEAARERLLEFFEAVAGSDQGGAVAQEWADLGCTFSGDELALVLRLSRAPGKRVDPEALYRAFAAHRIGAGDLPDRGLVRMVLRRIRDKIAAAGLPIVIDTRPGCGSALILTAPGFSLPGQA